MPGRSLRLLAAFIVAFIPVYWVAVCRTKARDGIFQVWRKAARPG